MLIMKFFKKLAELGIWCTFIILALRGLSQEDLKFKTKLCCVKSKSLSCPQFDGSPSLSISSTPHTYR